MISELLQEQIERWRRMRIHLVKPATTDWQRRLDEETYTREVENKDDIRDLLHIMAEAKEEVERWDDWMKNQEPEPGDSYRKWLDTARRVWYD